MLKNDFFLSKFILLKIIKDKIPLTNLGKLSTRVFLSLPLSDCGNNCIPGCYSRLRTQITRDLLVTTITGYN